jgi:hypothetical protein
MLTRRHGEDPLHDWIVGLAIVAIAAAVRLYGIGREPLWLDEGYSWWDARQSFADLWQLVPQCDPHPPLYALLLKGWSAVFGDSVEAMRALGGVIGVAATVAVMLAGREISSRVGWIAGVMFAVAPFQIEYAHEARPYALVSLGAALAMFGLLRIVRTIDDARARPQPGWGAAVVGLAIMLWGNNTAVLFAASAVVYAAVLFAFDHASRRLVRPALIAGAAVALIWLPYVPTLLEQARGVSSDFWIPRPDAWRVANELRFVVGLGRFDTLGLVLIVWAAGIVALWRHGAWRQSGLLFAMAALPVMLNLAVSLTVTPVYLARALIGISPAFALALACAIGSLRFGWLRVSAFVAFAAARLVAATWLYVEDNRKEPWDEIAEHVLQERHRETLVLLVPNELALPLGHALSEEDESAKVALRGVPVDFPAPGIPRARYPSGKCTPAVADHDLPVLAGAVRGRHEVIVVTRRNNVYDPRDRTQATLRSLGMVEASRREFRPGAIVVHRFVHPTTAAGGWP